MYSLVKHNKDIGNCFSHYFFGIIRVPQIGVVNNLNIYTSLLFSPQIGSGKFIVYLYKYNFTESSQK